MNDTIREWIPAYHDGELTGTLREQVEAHLATCVDCRADLAELRALSNLLAEPPLTLKEPAEAFAGRVMRRLPRRAEPFTTRAARLGLRYLPLGLFATWAFWQAVVTISGALLLLLGWVPAANNLVSALIPFTDAFSSGPSLWGMDLLNALLGASPVDLSWLDSFGLFIAVSGILAAIFTALFLGWIAGWWAYHRPDRSLTEKLS